MAGEILRRYTQLPALFYMLSERTLTLLDPNSWDDKNDSYFLEQYKAKRRLKTVLALCFSTAPETYHHWSIFANGSAGICVQFKRDELLAAIKGCDGVRYRSVDYMLLTTAKTKRLRTKDLPFTKRRPYISEEEWRIIYESATHERHSQDIAFPLASISRISLSPWLPEALKNHVKESLRKIEGCSGLEISRSTLISNEQWRRMGEQAV